MIRPIATLGLLAGGVLAAGSLTAAQWHAAGLAILALTLAHGLTVLPWALVALFAWRYWRWKKTALAWISYGRMSMAQTAQRKEWEWEDLMKKEQKRLQRRAAAPQRKRATR